MNVGKMATKPAAMLISSTNVTTSNKQHRKCCRVPGTLALLVRQRWSNELEIPTLRETRHNYTITAFNLASMNYFNYNPTHAYKKVGK